jgi:hypothetical protein
VRDNLNCPSSAEFFKLSENSILPSAESFKSMENTFTFPAEHSECPRNSSVDRDVLREKNAAFRQRGKGKWRLMQPVRRPVIANPQGEAIQRTRMDCFTLRVCNERA